MRHPTHWSKEDGTTSVEFALVFPVLAIIVLFTIYGALYIYYAAVAEHVARVAVRDASLPEPGTHTYPDQDATLTPSFATTVSNIGGALLPSPTSVSVTTNPVTSTSQEGDEVTVAVTYDLPALTQIANALWFIPAPPTSVTRTASARRE